MSDIDFGPGDQHTGSSSGGGGSSPIGCMIIAVILMLIGEMCHKL